MPQTSQACRPAAVAHGPLRTGVLGAAAAALATLPVAKALALDLDGDMGLITETVASRDRLKSYDSIKLYGAERVADRNRQYVLPDGILAGNYLIFPSLGAAVVYDDNIFKSNADKRSDVLLVPNGAIQETDSGPQVDLKNGTETKPVQIKIGLVGDSFTEVTSGLKEGDVVMLAAPRARGGGFGP